MKYKVIYNSKTELTFNSFESVMEFIDVHCIDGDHLEVYDDRGKRTNDLYVDAVFRKVPQAA